MQQAYNSGDQVDMIAVTGARCRDEQLEPRIREVVARAHHIDPTTRKALRCSTLR